MSTAVLPALRDELDLLPGPRLPDGQPSWTLHDPARNLFFRIDWPTFETLARWHLGKPTDIAAAVRRDTPLHTEPDDVTEVARFLAQHQLLRPQGADAARRMARQHAARHDGWMSWLLHHYLFFRIPLVDPDAFLGRWLPAWRRLRTSGFAWLTALALALGLWQVARQWEGFTASLVDTFSLSGLAAYGGALAVVKLLHELGHGFTARHHGCRVPAMGVAFLVLWPVAYTDTNEAWRLTDRRARLEIACAGIATELVVAAWSTLAWALLPDGAARSAAFVLATTSWLATFAINASPFMRFDGYFILSDALDLPNLHGRSFALARWRLREWLFDLREPAPEIFTTARTRALVLFAWATWLYRLGVYLGIAALVYTFAFKALGVLLFAVEIAWFIVWPLRAELREWRSRWPAIRARRRGGFSVLALLALLGLTALPWPGRIAASALLEPAETWPVHAPAGARVDALPFRDGEHVPAGEVVIRLHVPDVAMRRAAVTARIDQRQQQLARAGLDAEARRRLLVDAQALVTAHAELAGVDAESLRHAPRAPFAGRLRDLDPDLAPGQWLAAGERIGMLVREDGPWRIETWLEEDDAARVRPGDVARFVIDAGTGASLDAVVLRVEADASRTLPRPELASTAGGDVLVRVQDDRLVPERAVYRVTLDAGTPPPDMALHAWRGRVVIHARGEAPLARTLRHAAAVVVRELGL